MSWQDKLPQDSPREFSLGGRTVNGVIPHNLAAPVFGRMYDGLPWVNRRVTFWGFVIPLTAIACLGVGLRLHTRIFRIRCPGWDDALIFFAQLTATISAVCLCISAEYGLGQRSADVGANDKITFFKLFWVANAVFTMSNALVKLSLLAQYLRVFQVPALRLTCKVLLVIVAIWGSIYSFIAWFPCFPPSAFWDFQPTSTCYGYASPDPLKVYQTTVSATASNMAFDIITWALPIHLLADKGLDRKTKRALLALLMLGTIILGIAAGRCVANGSTAQARPDPFWNFPAIVLLGECENRLACILASIPIFWPVVEKAAGRIHHMYRVMVTQEFVVGSERILSGPVRVAVGAYEAPHWAESGGGQGEGEGRSMSSRSSADDSHHRHRTLKGPGAVVEEVFPTMAELQLPRWPGSLEGDLREVVLERHGGRGVALDGGGV